MMMASKSANHYCMEKKVNGFEKLKER